MGIKDKAQELVIREVVRKVKEDPKKNLPKLLEMVKKFDKENKWDSKYKFIEIVVNDPENNWNKYTRDLLNDIDEDVLVKFLNNFIMNATIKGLDKCDEIFAKTGTRSPWAIVMDPTTACNMHCTGCWAAEYGKSVNLGYETMDKIVTESKAMGTYWYLFTGGEPLVKKDEVLKLCKKHNDCIFVAFTNSTLIDEEFAKAAKEVGNLAFSISVEGTEESTDGRRGKGAYKKVMAAMDLLKREKLLFGFSTCVTSMNAEFVLSEEYYDNMIAKGCKFGWFFNYMPVGTDADTKLLTTPEQRKMMYDRIPAYRRTKPLFTVDFWNDGRFVDGCIAGGKYYMHINANGDVEPCVFIHYSNANIKEEGMTMEKALHQPIFEEYQKNQAFNENHLRPCPLLDNYGKLADVVKKSGAHSTDMLHPENVDDLCAKCRDIAKDWGKVADELWENDYMNPKNADKAAELREEAETKYLKEGKNTK